VTDPASGTARVKFTIENFTIENFTIENFTGEHRSGVRCALAAAE